MSDRFDPAELERFRTWVGGRLGFELGDGDLESLAALLRDRLHATGSSDFEAYSRRLAGSAGARSELRAVAARVTVGETYFFRNPDQLAAFVEVCLAPRAAAHGTPRPLRVLSAGCASGEEAYTIAILAREHLPSSSPIAITGVDVNAASLEKARTARYSPWALRQTSADHRARYFQQDGRELLLAREVRDAVEFEERNLLDTDPWRPASFEAVFLRNVLIYLTPLAARAVIARVAGLLAPEGYLFLGDAETLRGLSQDFHLRHSHGAFFYQLRGGESPSPEAVARHGTGEAPIALDSGTSWVDAIQRASNRIEALASSSSERAPASARAAWDITPVTDLFREERFALALEHLGGLPPESARDPDVQLLRAALMTNRGCVPEAEEVCEVVLELDELNAGAHYLKALCREHAGDPRAAAEHDRTAVHLDPTFAMPHLHLGLLAKRAGDLETARHSLERAAALLAREDPSRVLLFGGGFQRDALVRLASEELRASQRRPGGGAP